MIITGKWTTDADGKVVFVKFAQPLELDHDCDYAEEPGEEPAPHTQFSSLNDD